MERKQREEKIKKERGKEWRELKKTEKEKNTINKKQF